MFQNDFRLCQYLSRAVDSKFFEAARANVGGNGMSRLIGKCRNSLLQYMTNSEYFLLRVIPRDAVSAIIYIRRSQPAFENTLQSRQSKCLQWPCFSLLHPQVVCFGSARFLSSSCCFARRRPAGTYTHTKLSKDSTLQTLSLSQGNCGGVVRRVRLPFRRSGFRAENDAA